MPERPIKKKRKKKKLHFLAVIDFQRHGGVFMHRQRCVYFRETNQETKPGALAAAAPGAVSMRWCCLAVLRRPAVQIFLWKDSIS